MTESIYFNCEYNKNTGYHKWDKIYKKNDKIYHEKYKYYTLDDIYDKLHEYILDGYVLDKTNNKKKLIILRKDTKLLYLWPKENDIEEVSTQRLY